MTTKVADGKRLEPNARLRWVPIDQIKVNPLAQRELNQARVDRLVADLDLDQIGNPICSFRDGSFWCIDGQHRIEALRAFGFETDKIQCWVYEGLTSQGEADMFLKRNDVLAVNALAKYRSAVHAGWETESEIERVLHANGLVVSRDNIPNSVGAVGTLVRIFKRSDSKTLSRTVRIAHDSYGDPGLEAAVLDGIGLLCQRYNGDLDDASAIAKLGAARGGVNSLLGKAEILRRQTGNAKGHCVAAAAVEIINSGRGGKKLPGWWKADA